MSSEPFEQLKASLVKAVATLERQANNQDLPASARKQSARSLARYRTAIAHYYPDVYRQIVSQEGQNS